jgi:hypothetical protein
MFDQLSPKKIHRPWKQGHSLMEVNSPRLNPCHDSPLFIPIETNINHHQHPLTSMKTIISPLLTNY